MEMQSCKNEFKSIGQSMASNGSIAYEDAKEQFEKSLSQSNFDQVILNIKGMNSQIDLNHFE